MASRNFDDLHEFIRERARKFIEECKFGEWQAFMTDGYRTAKEQAELYAQGRTKSGKRVTNAKAGESVHQYRLAFDIAFVNKKGEVSWNPLLYIQAGKIAKKYGLEWGGNWLQFKDMPHFQDTGGLTIKELQAGKLPNLPKSGTITYHAQTFMGKMLEKFEGKLVQNVQGDGSFALVLNGHLLTATPERLPELLATYLIRKEGSGLSKELWENATRKPL